MKTRITITVMVAAFAAMTLGAHAQTTAGECEAARGHPDRDVARQASQITANNLCVKAFSVPENGLTWRMTLIENTDHPGGPTIFLLHDNEDSAFDTAIYGISKYGGKIVAVEGAERRSVMGVQDPNRNFGRTEAETATCRAMVRKPAPIFTDLMMDLQPKRAKFILTLHNNANGHTGNGGSGAISAARSSAVLNGLPAPNGGDEDDAILLAGTKAPGKDSKANKATKFFHKAGVNVIYEHVIPARNDCSFSNFVILNNLGEYYNIEAQHGHTAQQIEMLDLLMQYKRVKPRG